MTNRKAARQLRDANMTVITVICREASGNAREDILIYTVYVNPKDGDAVQTAVEKAREADLGFHVDMEILFAFAGEPSLVEDWRW